MAQRKGSPVQDSPSRLTILLLISWKWISQTFSTTSSFSKVTKPNPTEKGETEREGVSLASAGCAGWPAVRTGSRWAAVGDGDVAVIPGSDSNLYPAPFQRGGNSQNSTHVQQAPCGLHLPQSKQEIDLSVIYKGRSLLALCGGGRLVGYRQPLGSLRGLAGPFCELRWLALGSASMRRRLLVLFFLNDFL